MLISMSLKNKLNREIPKNQGSFGLLSRKWTILFETIPTKLPTAVLNEIQEFKEGVELESI